MKTVIIAEAGVNHNGDMKLAKLLIEKAHDAGADFVKFQTAVDCTSKFAPKAEYQKKTTGADESQLEMAKKYHIPILIHMREATKDTLDILKEHRPLQGIFHCYSGSYETAVEAMKLGFYISYGGPLTFKNSRGAPEVAEKLSVDRLFVETDSPYLTPHPHRGKQNEPMYVEVTFQRLCEIKGMSEAELAEQLERNYQRLFYNTLRL